MTQMTSEYVPSITVGGTPLTEQWEYALRSVRVERATNLVGRATLRFRDEGYALSAGDTFALGTKVAITQPEGGPLLTGTVTGVTLELVSRLVPELVVVVDDAAYKLMRHAPITTYLNGTPTQVIIKMASTIGAAAQVQASTQVAEYLMQAGSDLAYLDAICERLGYCWWIDDGASAPVLVAKEIKAGEPVATLTLGEELGDFTVRASGLRPTAVTVRGWDPDTQAAVVSTPKPETKGSPPTFVVNYTGGTPGSKLSKAATTVTDTVPLTKGEADARAAALLDDWTSASVVARGTCDVDSALKPGVTVKVAEAGPASGTYLVTAVEHVFDSSGFTTRFHCGPRRPAGLVDTLGPAADAAGFTVPGLVVGQVTNITDPDGVGRVKVKYTALSGEVESPWARVVTMGGGMARGAVFQPEVNDEVLVAFEHGDSRRPVVLGGLWSKKNTLPTGKAAVANGSVDYRRITSRKNHVLEFADGAAPTEQHVLLQLGTKQHKLRLGADRVDLEVTAGTPVSITAGSAKFEITNSGDISIEGANVTIKANGALSLEGAATAKLKSNGQTSVEGTTTQVKGQATVNVEASGPLALKGAMVAVN